MQCACWLPADRLPNIGLSLARTLRMKDPSSSVHAWRSAQGTCSWPCACLATKLMGRGMISLRPSMGLHSTGGTAGSNAVGVKRRNSLKFGACSRFCQRKQPGESCL
ncbi:hypothetical protein EMIHUDRAFT_365641, partial [Emiliania huxleyi CCMP1516]|uniref:Uncharacterized protein n=2 Tax=Emiliania huxleyi TaxID=2903 RepID=A0A0D3K226_EMIH1